MIRLLKVFEFVWIGVSVLSVLKVIDLWGSQDETERTLFWIFAGFSVLGVFMFFFRRRMRRKMEARKQDQSA
ncbi:MAG: Uncharacterised protein [Flavobacteriia bacterium]|nr:MAG: Uncharacterised protein [Flavobacteriia bacterium]